MRDVIEQRELPDRDGFQLVAYKVPDTDSTPYDADCYGTEDIESWKADHWSYVGVIVTASRHGVKLGEASLWGTEDGYSPGFVNPTHNPTGYVDAFGHTLGERDGDYDLPGDAVAEAAETLAKLREG